MWFRITPKIVRSQIPRPIPERLNTSGRLTDSIKYSPRGQSQESTPQVVKKSKVKKPAAPKCLDQWLSQYQDWSDHEQKIALKKLIDLAAPNNVRYMREGIVQNWNFIRKNFSSILIKLNFKHIFKLFE